ncbi:MAG TPA: hypothetical protein VFE96_00625 [Candidatus Bathyarchaeia archaeon]|nr:hypothetical protein [Candidatus Bathyarchaeia archaeon]
MPVYSLVGEIQTEYDIAGGKPIVRITSAGGVRHRAVYTGIATLLFHWVQTGKTQSWRFDPSISNPQIIQPEETTDSNNNQLLTFTLPELLPATGLLKGRWEGAFFAPAIHIDVPWGADIWIFLLRSPWFPLRLSLTKQTLTLVDGQSVASASVTAQPAGTLSTTISSPGTPFKKVSLIMNRQMGQFVSQEPISEIEAGTINQEWRPIFRNFDLCLVTKSSMGIGQLSQIAQGLGADFSSGFFGPGSLKGEFILCDGPLTQYSLAAKGDLGFLRHVEDLTQVALTW